MESFEFDTRELKKYDSLYFAPKSKLAILTFWSGWFNGGMVVTASVLASTHRLRRTYE